MLFLRASVMLLCENLLFMAIRYNDSRLYYYLLYSYNLFLVLLILCESDFQVVGILYRCSFGYLFEFRSIFNNSFITIIITYGLRLVLFCSYRICYYYSSLSLRKLRLAEA